MAEPRISDGWWVYHLNQDEATMFGASWYGSASYGETAKETKTYFFKCSAVRAAKRLYTQLVEHDH